MNRVQLEVPDPAGSSERPKATRLLLTSESKTTFRKSKSPSRFARNEVLNIGIPDVPDAAESLQVVIPQQRDLWGFPK